MWHIPCSSSCVYGASLELAIAEWREISIQWRRELSSVSNIREIDSHRSGRAKGSPQCYVRITNRERKGFVEFNFSIGDPTLFLEMILTVRAFDEFCKTNKAQFLTPDQEQMVDRHEAVWFDSVAGEGPGCNDDRENN
jgi:phenol/toluene 2-monooxygenase (NADH) P0/A0